MPLANTSSPPASGSAGPSIFISYRRVDSSDVTGRIYDQLVSRFGNDAVFKDVDSIPLGDEFREVIGTAVRRCKVVLVIIGEKWLEVKDDDGGLRLANPNDYVRIEIETGLEHAYKVIPVVVQNTRMPTEKDLPDNLKRLVARNGCMVRPDPDFHRDIDSLVAKLEIICRNAATAVMPVTSLAPLTSTPEPTLSQSAPAGVRSVTLIPRSMLFYWWPVWLTAFLMGSLSTLDDSTLVELPGGRSVTSPGEGQYLIKLQSDDKTATESLDWAVKNSQEVRGIFQISGGSRSRGVIFMTVLLLVILITNVRLRGWWSIAIVVVIEFLAITFALLDMWDNILRALGDLQPHASASAYFVFSLVILSAWLVTFLFVDRKTYAVITPTEVRIKDQIGGQEMVFETAGLTIAKERDDLFLHWILGMGSGNVILRTSGANGREIVLPNVLFAAHKMMLIEKMLRDRPVVFGG